MARASLRIDGLRCDGCAAGLAAVLREVPGVRDVDFAPDSSTVTIGYDEAKTAPAALATIIREEGYGAALAG
ncbi:MAG TPA: heavy-metal-associated domain-containing protein [Thermoanaerobaculia bacterium]